MGDVTAAAIAISATLLAWKGEIEQLARVPVIIAMVEHEAASNSYSLAADAPRREMLTSYLKQPDFLREFSRMNAMLLNHKEPGEPAYVILLNGARRAEWGAHSEALLAHELGHAWVKAQGYATPAFVNNRWACVGVHSGDITQHVLIRAELKRRQIDYETFWVRQLELSTAGLEAAGSVPEAERCARVAQASELVDVRLGLDAGRFPGLARYEAAVARTMPEVGRTADEIVAYLRQNDVADKDPDAGRAGICF